MSLAATYDDNIYAERPYAAPRTYVTDAVVYTLSPSLTLNFDAAAANDYLRVIQFVHDNEVR